MESERIASPTSDLKHDAHHVEYQHLDLLTAADKGHLATDEKGNRLVEIDEAASLRLSRKMDLRIVPIVFILYLFCFIDRANIGNARLAGLEKDLGLVGYDYNTLLSVFYVSYILFEIPSNLACKKFGPGKWIPLMAFTFGLLSLVTAFVNTLSAALAVRFLLGISEAGMLPGIAYYLSRWYPKEALVFRLSLYIVAAPLAGAFGGLLASGILTLKPIGSVHTWQLIFLIEGIITCGLAIISYFILTDRPETAKWLTTEEKALAEARLKVEMVGQAQVLDKISLKSLKNGIFAPSTLAIGFIFLLNNITVQGVAFFTPTIVKTIYPTKTTVELQLQTVPPYVVGAFFTVLVPYLSYKLKRRGLAMLCSAPLMMAGYVIFVSTTNSQARYGATFLITSGAFSFGALCNGWASMNVSSDSARAAAIGYVVMAGNCGGLISTWSFLPNDAPNYIKGNSLNLATSSTIFITAAMLMVWMTRDNKKRDRGEYDHRLDGVKAEDAWELGNKQPGFRYTL